MRPRILISRAAASLLALCLLITPLCSARCALVTCLPASAPAHSAGSCHHSSAKSHSATLIVAVAAASCQSADSLFDALPAQQTFSLKAVTSPVLQLPVVFSSLSNAATAKLSTELASLALDSSPGLLFSSAPLRL